MSALTDGVGVMRGRAHEWRLVIAERRADCDKVITNECN